MSVKMLLLCRVLTPFAPEFYPFNISQVCVLPIACSVFFLYHSTQWHSQDFILGSAHSDKTFN